MAKFNYKDSDLIFKVIIGILILVILGLAVTGIYMYTDYQNVKKEINVDTFYSHVTVNYVDLEGLTKEEALVLLDKELQQPLGKETLTLVNREEKIAYEYSQFGVKYDFVTAVDEAYEHGRTGSVKERYKLISELPFNPFNVQSEYTFDEELIKNEVRLLAEKLYVEPVNATMKRKNNEFVIIKEIDGRKVNEELLINAIEEMISMRQESTIAIPMEIIQPEYTSEKLSQSQSIIGSYSTGYSNGDEGRITNMRVAASKLNDTVIYPDEIFSTNAAFGSTTAANGYKPAPTIVGGKLVDDYGGGVCQVSSTLYNAILYAELDVVERQNHSLKVGYTDYGFDATLAGDYIDLKFKNQTKYPVYIESHLRNNKVVVNLYGYEEHPNDRRLVFEKALIDTTPAPAENITYDDTLEEGVRQQVVSALTGYKYKVYKLVYEGDHMLEKVLVNTSTYKPRRAEIVMGTKKPDPNAPSDIESTPESVAASENLDDLETIPSLEQTTEPSSNPINMPIQEQITEQEPLMPSPIEPEEAPQEITEAI